jgi:hypothetical protein
VQDAESGNVINSVFVRSSAPTLDLDLTDYGYRYYGVRNLDEEDLYVRGYHFVMPFTQIRPAQVGQGGARQNIISGHHWAPIDDYNTMVWNWTYNYGPTPLTDRQREQFGPGIGRLVGRGVHGRALYRRPISLLTEVIGAPSDRDPRSVEARAG